MKNLIVDFCSLKGGQGKSTLCATFATYLVEQNIPVVVLDADIQRSVYRHRQRDLEQHPEITRLPWQVEPMQTDDLGKVQHVIDNLKKVPGCIIFDCPGSINDPALKYIYNAADIAVIPMRYDSDSMDATILFKNVFRKVSSAKIFFVPNNIVEVQEKREQTQNERRDARKLLGLPEFPSMDDKEIMTPRIKQCTAVRCYNTFSGLERYQRNAVKYAFEPIVNYIKEQTNG